MKFSELEMSREDAEDLAYRAEMEEIVADYSGRGMYGEECLGMIYTTSDATALVRLGWALRDAAEEAEGDKAAVLEEMLTDVRTDSMGREGIVYFPKVSVGGVYE